MVDPKNYREVAIDLDSFKREIEPRFGLLTKLVFMLLTIVMGGGIGGGFVFYSQLGDIKSEVATQAGETKTAVAGLTAKVGAVDDRIGRMEMRVNTLADAASQRRFEDTLGKIESRLSSVALQASGGFTLAPDEKSFLLQVFNVSPKGRPIFTLNQTVPEAKPLPDQVILKYPRLKGFRYAVDANGWLAIADSSNRVLEIIGPSA